jgi:hypothetical protein
VATWLWLNLLWGALFVLAVVGVPLWLVIARPDTGPQREPASVPHGRRTAAIRGPSAPAPRVAQADGAGRPTRRWPAGVS